MQVERRRILDLSSDPANVRTHDDRNIDAIAASLRRFGQQKPIVVDANGVVRAGNGTLEAAKRLGWESIEVVRSDLAGSEATAYAIADNRTAELAGWDETALAAQLGALKAEDAELLAGAGFAEGEIPKHETYDSGRLIREDAEFRILIECDDERAQASLFDRLTTEGLRCKMLML